MAGPKKTIDGVPQLSRQDIEKYALLFLEEFAPEVLTRPQPTPLDKIAAAIQRRFRVAFDFTQELSPPDAQRRILGAYSLSKRTIYVDISLANTERFPFVLGHELGHLVFHDDVRIPAEEYQGHQDPKTNFDTGKKNLTTPRDWLEWQANTFASAILMPRVPLEHALATFQQEVLGMTRNIGQIFVDDVTYSQRALTQQLAGLAAVFGVNVTNIQYRLSDLGLLVDMRNADLKHISKLFREERA